MTGDELGGHLFRCLAENYPGVSVETSHDENRRVCWLVCYGDDQWEGPTLASACAEAWLTLDKRKRGVDDE